MKFTDIFIRRPVLAICVSLVILIAGLQSIRSLSVRQYPRSDIAVVQVSTVYVGANADLVRGFITTPLERVIASADGIDYMESSSMQGISTITVHLKLNYDTNAALTQIQSKVAQVRNDLPPEAEAPIIDLQTADQQFAAMYLGFSSSDLDQNQITDYLTRVVQPKLSAISGVQRADILGKRTFAMRIWLKPDKMAALGITPSQVHDALANNNYLSALGKTKGSMVSVNLVANTDLKTPEEFRQLVVKQDKGTIVRLGEIADVVLGAETYDEDVRFNGESATFMGVWVLPTANSLDVIKQVRDAIPGIRAQLPAGMKVGIPYDSTAYIQDAIKEVLSTLSETLIIVIIVIFLFLGSFRSVLIPVVAIPISLIGAVFIMLVAGFTINLLTLLAIVLSVGLVVDDAIVMVENVERHLHEGKTPFRAAIDAARELVGPIIAMTITLAAVYAPIGIQGGLTGALFREFAFTLAGAVIVSGIVALTLSPMMGSKLLRAGDTERGFSGFVNRRFENVRRLYSRMLASTLRWRPVVFGVWIIVALLMVPFYIFSQRELAPAEDQGVVFGVMQAAPNSTLDQTKLFASQVYDVYHSFPEAESIFQITDPNGGFGGMVTKPWSQRTKTAQQLLLESTGPLSKIAGIRVIPLTPPALPGGGNFPVDFVIASSAEPQQLAQFANELVKRAFASHMFIYADSDLKFDQPQAEVVFDRDKLRSQGVDLSQA
ncbi:MAG TPA: efflux RND transporter permease subunit, partial [Terriglobales bacterium]|nr:efflux RND transporter permease subunit [Terriglobales bacterium]